MAVSHKNIHQGVTGKQLGPVRAPGGKIWEFVRLCGFTHVKARQTARGLVSTSSRDSAARVRVQGGVRSMGRGRVMIAFALRRLGVSLAIPLAVLTGRRRCRSVFKTKPNRKRPRSCLEARQRPRHLNITR
jgi:hypothetical protein